MRRRPRLHLGALAACLSLVLSLVLTATLDADASPGRPGQQVPDAADLNEAQNGVRQRQADVAAELDVLHATSEEVGASLATLTTNVTAQQEQLARAQGLAETARLAEAAAAEQVAAKQAEVDRLKRKVQQLAVNLYTRPPVEDAVHALVKEDLTQAPVALALARFRVEDVAAVLEQTELARDALVLAQEQAATARAEAERAAAVEAVKLGDLEAARSQQQAFAVEVSDRIERTLGEAMQLSAQDAELSFQIQQRELDLAARLRDSLAQGGTAVIVINNEAGSTEIPVSLPAAAAPVTTEAPPPPNTTTTVEPPAPQPNAGTAAPTTASTAAPVTTRPPATTTTTTVRPIVINITPVDTTWVRGIEVASVIAPQFEAMMAAAEASGLRLTGSGYRNILEQIEIRREVCGPTDYDIFVKPSWECSPPVAIPGRSMHERGLAIDFSDADDLIRSREHPAYLWLAEHAKKYGFYNLPSEPWHWSTTGG